MLAFTWTPWWGTLPDYLAAAGTVGAFVAGLRLLRKELDARREAVEDRRRAQARLVNAWTTPAQWQEDPDGSGREVFYLLTRNGSDEPVYDVEVTLFTPYFDFVAPPPGKRPTGMEYAQLYEVVPPHETLTSEPLAVEDNSPGGPISITFRDSADRRWVKNQGRIALLWEDRDEPRRSVKDRLDAFAKGQVDVLDT